MNGRLQENGEAEAEASAHAQEHVFVLFCFSCFFDSQCINTSYQSSVIIVVNDIISNITLSAQKGAEISVTSRN